VFPLALVVRLELAVVAEPFGGFGLWMFFAQRFLAVVVIGEIILAQKNPAGLPVASQLRSFDENWDVVRADNGHRNRRNNGSSLPILLGGGKTEGDDRLPGRSLRLPRLRSHRATWRGGI
jgi:hypothetical protein